MAMAYTANERGAIEEVVQLYIEGVSKGDADKIRKAFHGDAWMSAHSAARVMTSRSVS